MSTEPGEAPRRHPDRPASVHRIHPEVRPQVLNQHTCPICHGLDYCPHGDPTTLHHRLTRGIITPQDPATLINQRRLDAADAYAHRWRTRAWFTLWAVALGVPILALALATP